MTSLQNFALRSVAALAIVFAACSAARAQTDEIQVYDASIAAPGAPAEYPQFADGLRQLVILQAELESHRARGWVEVPAH